ncbi:hypothetical protein LCGC14_1628230 [marine sediment metagenome]|uniref:Uncharacterized protein n=1 Tax=marine sediment metagenome TaxID=412755 RepID=A0A0F9IQI0_9ZZZZ
MSSEVKKTARIKRKDPIGLKGEMSWKVFTHTEDGIFISNLDEPIKSIYDVAPKIRELLGEDITYYAPIPDTPEVLWES